MRTGRFAESVPEEWREYKAIKSGAVAAQPYDEMLPYKADLFIEFAYLEHEAARAAVQRAQSGR